MPRKDGPCHSIQNTYNLCHSQLDKPDVPLVHTNGQALTSFQNVTQNQFLWCLLRRRGNQSIGQYLSGHKDTFSNPPTNKRLEETVVGDWPKMMKFKALQLGVSLFPVAKTELDEQLDETGKAKGMLREQGRDGDAGINMAAEGLATDGEDDGSHCRSGFIAVRWETLLDAFLASY
ncbi:hypothetical protein AVEN_66201-1 [Araneus ventricosus]|uniref:Uncharacterized protein n=1 Tax=Araneus ventricosus TaxID=182803 RepID=A0A4Y2JHH3_ARAVE|nr:hypothetical protein AVEN_66201-1 [Araneus ventricosus]